MVWLKSKNLLAGLSALLFFTAYSLAQTGQEQEERIVSFDSYINLHADGTMQVRETIAVEATGDQIRHGIYRDFPTRYIDRWGNKIAVAFKILGAQRDGSAETYHTESLPNGVRVYFGESNKLVSPGAHRYIFSYETSRQISFLKDHDELYWNVTGDGWIFPIDLVTVTVVLPPRLSTAVTGLYGYTGAQGENGQNFTASRDQDGNPSFRSANLAPLQGLTIAVTWTKGLIAEPSPSQKFIWYISDNPGPALGLLGLIIVLVYYVVVWVRVGRDPKPGVIMPLYEPPKNMSPAAMRYLKHMSFDDKTFSSAILGLAAKGWLTIKQQGEHNYYLIQKDARASGAPLYSDEKTLNDKLFSRRRTIDLSGPDHSSVSTAKSALFTALQTAMEKTYFLTNARYLWPGSLVSLVFGLAMLLVSGSLQGGQLSGLIFTTICLWGGSYAVAGLLDAVARAWKHARQHKVAGGANVLLLTFLLSMSVIVEISFFGVLANALSIIGLLLIALLIGSNVLFHHLLKAPTRAGRELLDRVDGFKMFLSEVAGDCLHTTDGPARTPQLFGRFLPYAVALEVETAWANQFSQLLATAGAPGPKAPGYVPSWFTGAAIAAATATAFASSFSSAFSNAVSASSQPLASSSGGHGFSGGGGGGGGGGGW